MRVRFWGTRGSIAKPGPTTVRYGGNTSCVEVRSDDGTLIVLDCGTGAQALGQALLAESPRAPRGNLFIGHTHWDHIQGFPFFGPLFVKGGEWDIYGPAGLGQHLQKALAGQMQHTYFPVSLEQLSATLRFHDLSEGELRVGGILVRTNFLNHPALTLAYRLEADGVSVVYATDHEPHSPALAVGEGTCDAPVHREDLRHQQFLRGADLIIHDAQYTAAEYPTKVGWGHSTVEYVTDVARAAGARRLALFHHDPFRTDDALDALVQACRARTAAAGGTLEVIAAAEGQMLELEPSPHGREVAPRPEPSAPAAGIAARTILLALGDPKDRTAFEEAFRAGDFQSIIAPPGSGWAAAAAAEHPALVIADSVAGRTVEELRALRSGAEEELRELPVVIVTSDAAEMEPLFRAGASDVLCRPVSPAYARSRVKTWLLRTHLRWKPAPLPPNEHERLAAVQQLRLMDTPPDEQFDRIARLTARVLDVPMAAISLIDAERQWYKSRVGISLTEVPRAMTLCGYTLLNPDGLVVTDLEGDDRFGQPRRLGNTSIRFYAGQPVKDPSGHSVGTLCVMDTRPRQLRDEDQQALRDMAALAEEALARASRTQ